MVEYIDMQSARIEDPEPENAQDTGADATAATPEAGAPTPEAPKVDEAAKLVAEAEKRRFDQAFSKLATRESRQVEREQTFRQQQAEFERQRAEFESQKKEVEEQRALLRRLHEDPNVVEAFQANKLDFADMVKRMANNNSPENQARALEMRLKAEFEARDAEIKRLRDAEEARTRAQEEQAAQAQLAEERKWCLDYVEKNEELYPELSAQPPGKIVGMIEFIGEAEKRKNGGRTPKLDTVLKIAEDLVAQESQMAAAKKAARAAKKAPAPAQQGTPAAASSTTPSAKQDAPAQSPESEEDYEAEVKRRRSLRSKALPTSALQTGERATTIGNRAASERVVSSAPVSREELRKRLAEKYMA